MARQWYYATLEWVWTASAMRLNIPGQPESLRTGSYQEVVELLTQLGMQGWEVVGCVATGDWVYWTLQHDAIA